MMARAGAAAGTLRRKIHLHIVCMGIAPPMIGPVISEMAYIEEMNAINVAYFSFGTRSRQITLHIAKHPPPPRP
jgi:hypothetical protein